ncbi:hypothetical protein M514_05109 [Trichuris suis]|uniref:Uncharacterized protein n=1 Tax=Trichuris suis TaxID=68888 RepID=A0A085N0L3_9BILA|nr:hypothetical protein M513_05109 [Trichuris suis]KFD63009.1 hypothetical protein M514_05109 [Trichuris suis]
MHRLVMRATFAIVFIALFCAGHSEAATEDKFSTCSRTAVKAYTAVRDTPGAEPMLEYTNALRNCLNR